MAKGRAVTIEASKTSTGDIEFSLHEKGKYTEILVFNKNKDGMKKSEFYDIEFTLDNKNGANVAFVTDTADVMHLSKGSDTHLPKCPKSGGVGSDNQFSVTSVTETTLKVQNKDETECFYKFILNFVDKNNGNKKLTFDPIYGNQNGGGGPFQMASPTMGSFIGGAALGVLITVVAVNILSFG